MFFVFGVATRDRDVSGVLPRRGHCVPCGFVSDLRQQRRQRWITLFFLPVIPISKVQDIITCNRCGASFLASHPGFQSGMPGEASPDKAVLVCPSCSEKMRVPVSLENAIRVRCPHCREQFTISVNKS